VNRLARHRFIDHDTQRHRRTDVSTIPACYRAAGTQDCEPRRKDERRDPEAPPPPRERAGIHAPIIQSVPPIGVNTARKHSFQVAKTIADLANREQQRNVRREHGLTPRWRCLCRSPCLRKVGQKGSRACRVAWFRNAAPGLSSGRQRAAEFVRRRRRERSTRHGKMRRHE
jgi:hypothetical protein